MKSWCNCLIISLVFSLNTSGGRSELDLLVFRIMTISFTSDSDGALSFMISELF